MIQEGQITLFAFPQTDQAAGNLRPALVLRSLSGPYNKIGAVPLLRNCAF